MSDARPKDLELGELPGTEPELPPYEAAADSTSIIEEERRAFLHSDPESTAPPVHTSSETGLESMPVHVAWPLNILAWVIVIMSFVVGLGFIFTFFGLFIKAIAFIWKKIGLIS
ncbi:hypothetical protein F5Y04DRAFT_284113 [Hypomontagnella monticulosa]|nr:hypothetical protein F5Y04DRAFT_284113 [Hypomontagnella monticulosa]